MQANEQMLQMLMGQLGLGAPAAGHTLGQSAYYGPMQRRPHQADQRFMPQQEQPPMGGMGAPMPGMGGGVPGMGEMPMPPQAPPMGGMGGMPEQMDPAMMQMLGGMGLG